MRDLGASSWSVSAQGRGEGAAVWEALRRCCHPLGAPGVMGCPHPDVGGSAACTRAAGDTCREPSRLEVAALGHTSAPGPCDAQSCDAPQGPGGTRPECWSQPLRGPPPRVSPSPAQCPTPRMPPVSPTCTRSPCLTWEGEPSEAHLVPRFGFRER